MYIYLRLYFWSNGSQMRAEKSNFRVYSSLSKISSVVRPTNVVDLTKKNKIEKKKEKIQQVYTLLGFIGLFLLVIFMYL